MYFIKYKDYIIPLAHSFQPDGSVVIHSYTINMAAKGADISEAIDNLTEAIEDKVAHVGLAKTFEYY